MLTSEDIDYTAHVMVTVRAVCAISHAERLERSFAKVTECTDIVM